MPQVKSNVFTKLLLLLFFILLPIVILYLYSNRTSVNLIKSQVQELNLNRLTFFTNQIEDETNQLSVLAGVISRDYSVQSLQSRDDFSSYAEISSVNAVEQKLRLQQLSSKWSNQLVVYYPHANRIVPDSLSSINKFDVKTIVNPSNPSWIYEEAKSGAIGKPRFSHFVVDPYLADSTNVQQITKTYFSIAILEDMLFEFNKNKQGETFLYQEMHPAITGTSDPQHDRQGFIDYLKENLKGPVQNKLVVVNNQEYLLNALILKGINWYAIDVVPINAILSPITKNRNLFYISIAILILMGVAASLWLYRYIQIPMGKLLVGVRRVRQGDYSIRLEHQDNNEFGYLLTNFNQMATEIQTLIEQVYAEQIHSREAKFKQLQSQINPHFLYNCLFYIMNMATLGDEEAVVAMSLNLGEYFRYTTRIDKQSATVREEIQLIKNYLNIQQLRIKRLSYEIEIPEEMLDLEIPRLALQPIVENAVIHGIDSRPEQGYIHVKGISTNNEFMIIIEDNGRGMSVNELEKLKGTLLQEHQEEMGYGVWNVHQRFALQFGESAGLDIHLSKDGGMQFIVRWNLKKRL
ncbi:HAMP domain-containing protein [Paenibacillus psychroresistens]|uniref:HAMP domain-containing protein n=1 Tax=Paenibacillus psychroresistens TaxID=1778678 RepID=A0A6B8RGD6_9BACL|nr:histidine kinase [Paenibacillus psychroresistens]QGQ95169.1 HAMP domain-containing protein [Paenibacillus psychroresistens]